MTEHRDDEALRARLAAADPAASLPARGAEGTEGLLEDVMGHDVDPSPEPRATGARGRHPLTWVLAGAASLVIAGAVALIVVDADDADVPAAGRDTTATVGPSEPTDVDGDTGANAPSPGTAQVSTLSVAPVPQGRCGVPNPTILAGKQVAFEGVATRVAERTVTLQTEQVFAGSPAGSVTLQSAPGTGALLETIRFAEGGRYLVAASDGEVALCGLSGPRTGELEALYEDAFAG